MLAGHNRWNFGGEVRVVELASHTWCRELGHVQREHCLSVRSDDFVCLLLWLLVF